MTERFRAEDLIRFGAGLFAGAGMPEDRARAVAALLVEADLMGHDTHGLNLAPGYLKALQRGEMAATGEIETVSDRGAAVVWDGGYLSGVWLTGEAMTVACQRARDYGTATVVVRRSHHIGCLQSYLPIATGQGLMAIVMSSDPSNRGVAPHGSYEPVFTPDPLAVGIPTEGEPVLVDISASTTTLNLAQRLQGEGRRFGGDWVIGPDGRASDDPAVLTDEPRGAILPLGGLDRGHKGFGLALMVEALTAGLGGFGRADGVTHWGAAVFVQVIDPAAFGGEAAFRRETGWLAAACRAAAVAQGCPPVRLPGETGLKRRAEALRRGVPLYPSIMESLGPWAETLGVALPQPLEAAA